MISLLNSIIFEMIAPLNGADAIENRCAGRRNLLEQNIRRFFAP